MRDFRDSFNSNFKVYGMIQNVLVKTNRFFYSKKTNRI